MEKFVKFFPVRKSSKFWCGVWSDMAIEQTYVREMKCKGGLTRGRGVKDSVLQKWTGTMATMSTICEIVESFSNAHFSTSEQHVEMRSSRINET